MSGFKTEPVEMPDLGELSTARTKEEWVKEAPVRHSAAVKRRARKKKKRPSALPGHITFNLRLPEDRRAQLERVADSQERSMQFVAKKIIYAELDRLEGRAVAEPTQSHGGARSEGRMTLAAETA